MSYKLVITTKSANGHYSNPNRAYGGETFVPDKINMSSVLVEFETEKEAEAAISEIEKNNQPKPYWDKTEHQRLWKTKKRAAK